MSRAHTPCQANCGRPAGSGFVCNYCMNEFKAALEAGPELARELEIVLTRQTVYSTRYGSRSTDTPLPFNVKASEQLAWLRRQLHHLADWNLDDFRKHPDAGEAVNDLVNTVERGWWLVDRPPDRWYAGPCVCGRHLYATTKTGHFNCPHCKALWDADSRRTWMLAEAENHLAPAATAARAVTWLGGVEVTQHRIHMWVQRKRLVARGHEPYTDTKDPHRTRPLYRIGDILDLVAETIRQQTEAAENGSKQTKRHA